MAKEHIPCGQFESFIVVSNKDKNAQNMIIKEKKKRNIALLVFLKALTSL